MSWGILTDRAWTDLEGSTKEEREAIASDLMTGVEAGPPQASPREVGGTQLFQDELASGFEVVYLVNEPVPYAAIRHIRRRRRNA